MPDVIDAHGAQSTAENGEARDSKFSEKVKTGRPSRRFDNPVRDDRPVGDDQRTQEDRFVPRREGRWRRHEKDQDAAQHQRSEWTPKAQRQVNAMLLLFVLI